MDQPLPVLSSEALDLTVRELEQMAARIRIDIIHMIHCAGEGHPGGSLSSADIVTALYYRVMRIDPSRPDWPDRDRFILSKGHACPVWYSALAERGYFPMEHLRTLRCIDSILQGHPDMRKTPGIDMSTGSLGHGLSVGLGMALAARVQKRHYHVWVVLGDGEIQEGSVWEAAMASAAFGVDNLTAIIDRNRIQNDDFVDRIMPIDPVDDKWAAFGWRVTEIDGHSMSQLVPALEASRERSGCPKVIIANTVKGKGVSFMENKPAWHGRAPDDDETDRAVQEILADTGMEADSGFWCE